MPDNRQAPERRSAERFPMERQVRFKLAGGKPAEYCGTTVNMSSRGVLFTTTGPVTAGQRIEVSINWPAQLNERCALQFIAHGLVVRCDAHSAAVKIGRHEFRTRRLERGPRPISIVSGLNRVQQAQR